VKNPIAPAGSDLFGQRPELVRSQGGLDDHDGRPRSEDLDLELAVSDRHHDASGHQASLIPVANTGNQTRPPYAGIL
jgi:hypothetical protein